MKKIILASGSPTRKRLLDEAGFVFDVVESNYEEDMSLPIPPRELAMHLARGKAEAVAEIHREAIVIGADTFILYEDQILGKPHTETRAKEMLNTLNGKVHSVITGFTVIDKENEKAISRIVESKVYFKVLTEREIDDYIKTGEPLTKAGSYAILGQGRELIEKIEGDELSIAGLPVDTLKETLAQDFGIIV